MGLVELAGYCERKQVCFTLNIAQNKIAVKMLTYEIESESNNFLLCSTIGWQMCDYMCHCSQTSNLYLRSPPSPCALRNRLVSIHRVFRPIKRQIINGWVPFIFGRVILICSRAQLRRIPNFVWRRSHVSNSLLLITHTPVQSSKWRYQYKSRLKPYFSPLFLGWRSLPTKMSLFEANLDAITYPNIITSH